MRARSISVDPPLYSINGQIITLYGISSFTVYIGIVLISHKIHTELVNVLIVLFISAISFLSPHGSSSSFLAFSKSCVYQLLGCLHVLKIDLL